MELVRLKQREKELYNDLLIQKKYSFVHKIFDIVLVSWKIKQDHRKIMKMSWI